MIMNSIFLSAINPALAAGTLTTAQVMGAWTMASAVSGAAVGFASSMIMTGGDMNAAMSGGALGALSGGLFGAVGVSTEAGSFANYAGHAGAGCLIGMASGSGCGRGAASEFVSKWATVHTDGDPVVAVVAGGTVSVVGGGRFANGAVTAAYGYLFNWCSQNGCFNSRFDANVAESHYREGNGTQLEINVAEIDGILNSPNNRWSQDADDPNRYTVATFGSDGFGSNSQGRVLGSLTAIKQPNGSFRFHNDTYDFERHELKLDRKILSTFGRNVETFFARPVVGSGRKFDIKINGEWRPRGSLSGP